MDTMRKTLYILLLMTAVISMPAMASDGNTNTEPEIEECSKTGTDENKTKQEYSLYREFYKQGNYADAIRHWRFVFAEAPGLSKNTYTNGVKMFKKMADEMEDSLSKQALVDTAILIYKQRVKCYGDEGKSMGDIFYTLLKYRPDAHDEMRAYGRKAVELSGNETAYYILFPYFQFVTLAWKKDEGVSDDELLATYEELIEICEANIAIASEESDQKTLDKWTSTVNRLEDYLPAELLTCERLINRFAEKKSEMMDDANSLKKMYNQLKLSKDSLNGTRCTKTPEYRQIVMRIAELEPSAMIMNEVAYFKFQDGDQEGALGAFNDAIEMQTDLNKKADLAMTIAKIFRNDKEFSKAREYARKALEFRPDWGEPYILIGNMYASSGSICGGQDGELCALAAVDKYYQAKKDPEAAEEAQRLINKYSAYFPSKTYLFERTMSEGSSYSFKCWIGESTTIRAKK